MKKVIILTLLLFVFMLGTNIDAKGPATGSTWTLNADGEYIRTQDAYLPDGTYTDFGMNTPEDMIFDDNDILYIADSGNSRILLFETNQIIGEITNDEFEYPCGLFIRDNILYIADKNAEQIFVYDLVNKVFNSSYTKPVSVLYEKEFKPMKVSTDVYGNLYVIAESVNEGVIQLSREGEFLGYFATNKVTMTFLERIQSLIYTDAQKELQANKTPPVFSNLFSDKVGLLYTTTTYASRYQFLKKHNTAGGNLLTKYPLFAHNNFSDVYVDNDGIIYACSASGYIYVYTRDGECIYDFGEESYVDDISGNFNRLVSIAVNSKGQVFGLDGKKAFLQVFSQTDYSENIYLALALYNQADYEQSISVWTEVIKLNQLSNIAHNNIGLNYLYNQDYDEALYHLKLANNKSAYSEAFWEVRNIWLQHNLTWILICTISLFVVLFVVKKFDKKYAFLNGYYDFKRKVKKNKYYIECTLPFKVMVKPGDSFYEIKKERKGKFSTALIMFFVFFVIFLIYKSFKGFVYQYEKTNQIDYFSLTLGFFGIIGIFVVCNYLVTSIQDGNGGLKDILKIVVFSLGPLVIAFISIVILSHVMTQNEAFFLDVIYYVGIGWSLCLIFAGMMEIQGYSIKENIKSLLLTVMLMFIVLLVLLILFVLSRELLEFLETVFKEVIRNVQG